MNGFVVKRFRSNSLLNNKKKNENEEESYSAELAEVELGDSLS